MRWGDWLAPWTLALLLVAACGPSPERASGSDAGSANASGGLEAQRTYSYPGCAPGTWYCPNDRAVYCALDAIHQKHANCTVDGDCVEVEIPRTCTGWRDCGPTFVTAGSTGAFLDEVKAETGRYCPDAGGCSSSAACAPGVHALVARCVAGLCQAVSPDAGM